MIEEDKDGQGPQGRGMWEVGALGEPDLEVHRRRCEGQPLEGRWGVGRIVSVGVAVSRERWPAQWVESLYGEVSTRPADSLDSEGNKASTAPAL